MTHNVSFGWAEDAAIHHLLVPDRGLLRTACGATPPAPRLADGAAPGSDLHPLP